jgi:pyruvate,water dikinase
LAEVVSIVAAAFTLKMSLCMSDFKSNEYANLIGGKYFEPDEENPMIVFVVLLVITVISTRKDLH